MANIEFSDMEKDAIGEIMNISMGSASTAASELLNAKVWITTPRVSVMQAKELNYNRLEPAVCVKIVYVKGISGSNLMVLKQDDVQLILNQLMGQPLVVTPDFEFDELNISAVSEVMNQMMGASATALSDFLGVTVDISTPTPYIMDQINLTDIQDVDPEDTVVSITFDITIDGVIKSEFVSVMDVELAKTIATKMLGGEPEPEPAPAPQPTAQQPAQQTQNSQQAQQPEQNMQYQQPIQNAQNMQYQQPIQNVQNMQYQQPIQNAQNMQYQQPVQNMQYQQPMQNMQGMPMQDPSGMGMGYGYQQPYYYPPPYGYGYPMGAQPVNIQNAQLHQFESGGDANFSGGQKDNLQLLMGVPLQISVEIGTATRKVKEILEFSQGTIIELERQAGAPVDVVVNGNLIARGDVVVIDDNFAVRITEIIKSKFMDSLGKE